MIEHSTGNRKDLGSIPSGVEAFLFSQKISSSNKVIIVTISTNGDFLQFILIWRLLTITVIWVEKGLSRTLWRHWNQGQYLMSKTMYDHVPNSNFWIFVSFFQKLVKGLEGQSSSVNAQIFALFLNVFLTVFRIFKILNSEQDSMLNPTRILHMLRCSFLCRTLSQIPISFST